MARGIGGVAGRLAAVVLAVVTVLPVALVVYRSAVTMEGPTMAYYREILGEPANIIALRNTLAISLTTVVVSVSLGVPLAWLVARTDLPGHSWFRAMLLLPYVVPPYLGAIAWINLANPTVGWLNRLAGVTMVDIYTPAGIVWVEGLFLYTFVFVGCLAALERADPSLEEAARMSGASPAQVLRTVTLPLLRPAIVSGAFLVFAAAAASFGVPALLGVPGRVHVVTTRIYSYARTGGLEGYYAASALSAVLLLFVVGASWVAGRLGHPGRVTTVTGKASRAFRIRLGIWRWPACAAAIVVVLTACLVPFASIVLTSLMSVVGQFDRSNFTFDKYRYVLFERPDTARAFVNSLVLAFGASTLAVAAGAVLGYVMGHPRARRHPALDLSVSLPYATPGTVLALGLVLVWSWPVTLTDTLWILLLAYVAKYLSFAVTTLTTGVRQVDVTLEEAARVSGAGVLTVARTIWLPLLKPGLLAAWFLVFMPVFSELTMSVVLVGPGTDTVGTVLFALQEYADPPSASVVAVLVLLFVLAAYAGAVALGPRAEKA